MLFISVTNTKKKTKLLLKVLLVLLLLLTLSPYVYQNTAADGDSLNAPVQTGDTPEQAQANDLEPSRVISETELSAHWQQISYQLSI